jgi:mRNA interferase RelE/StbE
VVRHVLAHPKALRTLKRLGAGDEKRIRSVLARLAEDPYTARPGADIKKLKGTKGRPSLFRVRIGEFRAVYAVDGDVVLVTDIFRRGQGYDV